MPSATIHAAAASVFLALGSVVAAHDRGLSITWNREISRIVYDRCASCHRPVGSAFSLMTYVDAQPRTNAIKESVLSRRMPPWGAVKGFGNFRNDEGLEMPAPFSVPATAIPVSGPLELSRDTTLDGLLSEKVLAERSMQIVAALPTGSIEPLLWLYEYDDRYKHPFLLRRPIHLPAGTIIQGVPGDAVVALIPVQK